MAATRARGTRAKETNSATQRRLIGYARVSTEEQGTDPQLDELRDAGCVAIHREHASGADRSGPVLARLLREIAPGETLVVVRLDRLARSVSHLLAVIEQLDVKGAYFRSLRDPINRHHDAAGHVLPASPRCGRPAQAGTDRRADQSRVAFCPPPRPDRRQSGPPCV